jgi:predicted DNA-binding protein
MEGQMTLNTPKESSYKIQITLSSVSQYKLNELSNKKGMSKSTILTNALDKYHKEETRKE